MKKLIVHMKTPDALDMAIENATEGDLFSEEDADRAANICKKWFEYGESVTLEIDLDNETCSVRERKR